MTGDGPSAATRRPFRREDFAFGHKAIVEAEFATEDEWPYWEVWGRFYDVDGYCRKYRLRWLHPVTWDIKFDVVTEGNLLSHYEERDPDAVREEAREVMADAE